MTDFFEVSSGPAKKRVLAVDDEEEILRLYQTFLSFGGYEVVTVMSAEDCVRHLKEETPDMMLLDVNMPGIDGLKLLEFIRSEPRLAEMRVIMISAQRDEATVRKAVELGCDGYIVKPFKLKELERRITLELLSITEDDLRTILRAGVSVRTAMFKEPGLGEYSALHWDPYPLKYRGIPLCLLVPRGVRPAHFLKSATDELEKRLVVLFKHPQKWKKVWPRAARKTPAAS